MNFIDAWITRKIAKVTSSVSNLKEDAIKQMITDLRN